MRALGFSRMDSKAEAEFIQEGIKECIDEGLVLKNQKLNRGSMVVAAGESMGVYIYGGQGNGTQLPYSHDEHSLL